MLIPKKNYLTIIFVLIYINMGWTQDLSDFENPNLVENFSFETYEELPNDYGQINLASGWFGLKFSPDFFHAESVAPRVATPKNFFGEQPAAEGKAYVGILAYHENQQREFIATALTEPLSAGHAYYISFKASLAKTYSNLACNQLGVLFTNDLEQATEGSSPQIKSLSVVDSEEWSIVSDTIVVEEDYSFLVIGNFHNNEQVKTINKGTRGYPAAYYYIDEIIVKSVEVPVLKEGFIKISGQVKDQETGLPIEARLDFVLTTIKYRAYEESNRKSGKYEFSNMQRTTKFVLQASAKGYHSVSQIITVGDKDEVIVDFEMKPSSLGSTIVLESIVFESGEAILHKHSFEELNMIAKFLKEHPNYHVEISGHTDNVGIPSNNLALSEARAQAVVKYLHKQLDVNNSRMQAKGYGQSKPIVPNVNEENRRINRRVELTIVKD